MTTWRLWPATSGGSVTTDAATTDLGVQFTVSSSGLSLNGYFVWVPATGSTVAQTFRLWTTTNGTTGTIVSGSTVTSGTLTAGAWNFVALSPSVALSTGVTYVASATYTGAGNHYGATASYWTTGGGGASGVTNGPLSAPSSASALGTAQGSFNEPSTAGFPATASSNNANYWVDVQVTDGAVPAPVAAPPPVSPLWFPGAPAMPNGIPFAQQPVPQYAPQIPAAPLPVMLPLAAPVPAQQPPGWFPGADAATCQPGGIPFAQQPVPQYAPALPPGPALPFSYAFTPGQAIPGHATPGKPGIMLAPPPGAAASQVEPLAALTPPGWFPGSDGVTGQPGGVPFAVQPFAGGTPSPVSAAPAAAAPSLRGPVRAQPGAPRRGSAAGHPGAFNGTGPALKPPDGPVRAQPTARRGGSVASRSGTFTQVTLGAGPPVYPLHGPVQARRQLQRGGHVFRTAGPYDGTGPSLRPAEGPLRAQPAQHRGGSVQSRSGTFTFVSLTSGPPVYPLHGPVEARRLPQRGGSVSHAAGTFAGTGTPPRPLDGPVQARPPLPRGGRTAARAGTFTAVSLTSGPPVYPLGHPVQARRLASRGGSAIHRAGTFAGTGPAVPALKQPLGLYRRQPPPPARGQILSLDGIRSGTGPPVPPLHRPVRGQPQKPVLYGRAGSRAGIAVFVPPPPFTVGTLTATDAPLATLGASAASSGTATLTASDTRTGGPS